MSNLFKRVASGLTFGIILIGCIVWKDYSCFVALGLIIILSIVEFQNVTSSLRNNGNYNRSVNFLNIAIALSGFALAFGAGKGIIPAMSIIIFPAMFLLFFLKELWLKSGNPFQNIGLDLTGQVWIVLPFMFSAFVIFRDGDFNGYQLLFVFLVVWIYDSMAYFVGTTFGKTPLFKRISPKKSIEGLAGGTVLTLLIVLFLHRFYPVYSLKDALILTVIAIIFGTLGDLVESMLKRSLNIKDSGNIIPGHGGMLDRFDALFLALPATAIYILLFS